MQAPTLPLMAANLCDEAEGPRLLHASKMCSIEQSASRRAQVVFDRRADLLSD
jgi:hypothetical protein